MIKNIYLENFATFKNAINLNLEADNYTKKFPNNITKDNLIKSAVIYGPNNTGKTQLLLGIKAIKATLLNNNALIYSNIFASNNMISTLGISFVYDNQTYKYLFQKNSKDEFIYEKFSQIINNKEKIILLKDTINNKYKAEDKTLEKALKNTSFNNIVIYTLNVTNFKTLAKIKMMLTAIANKIEVIDMNTITNNKTIEILKKQDNHQEKIVSLIKNADLYLDDYYYDNNLNFLTDSKMSSQILKEEIDEIKMVSVYNGHKVSSLLFDSLGTKKIEALASYIIEALEEGKSLFIDELDSSLHFKLTRAIISMFNSGLNKNAQLICTLHDISLLDCQKLFRKEQIWFTNKDKDSANLFSLKEFSTSKTGIRDTTDLIEKYKKGLLGAIPEPDLIATLTEEIND